MAPATLVVPADLVEAIHDELHEIREGKLDGIANAEGKIGIDEDAHDDLKRYRTELALVDGVLAQVAWDDRRANEPVTLSGEPALLQRLVFGAVLAAYEHIGSTESLGSRVCTLDLPTLELRARRLIGLCSLLREAMTKR